MTPQWRFTVPGDPVAKARPRMNRQTGHVYTPTKSARFEDRVMLCAAEAGVPRLDGAVEVSIVAWWEWPKTKWRKTQPREAEPYAAGPDADNVAKAVLDGLRPCFNDRQVARLLVEKMRCAQGEAARCAITVRALS